MQVTLITFDFTFTVVLYIYLINVNHSTVAYKHFFKAYIHYISYVANLNFLCKSYLSKYDSLQRFYAYRFKQFPQKGYANMTKGLFFSKRTYPY